MMIFPLKPMAMQIFPIIMRQFSLTDKKDRLLTYSLLQALTKQVLVILIKSRTHCLCHNSMSNRYSSYSSYRVPNAIVTNLCQGSLKFLSFCFSAGSICYVSRNILQVFHPNALHVSQENVLHVLRAHGLHVLRVQSHTFSTHCMHMFYTFYSIYVLCWLVGCLVG